LGAQKAHNEIIKFTDLTLFPLSADCASEDDPLLNIFFLLLLMESAGDDGRGMEIGAFSGAASTQTKIYFDSLSGTEINGVE
jgi:hypothetical protein